MTHFDLNLLDFIHFFCSDKVACPSIQASVLMPTAFPSAAVAVIRFTFSLVAAFDTNKNPDFAF
jgi:hypothetical protein